MKEEVEVWKGIEGFPYQVSNFGNIKSLGRYIPYVDGRTGKQCKRWSKERTLKYTIGTSGYPTTHIYTDEPVRHTIMIHRFVALYHLENIDGRDYVNHIDGDKTNNHISNLEWVTFSENVLHALDTGLLRNRGEDSVFAKLSERQVKEILSLRKFNPRKYTCKHISQKYGISEKYVSYLSSGNSQRWKCLLSSLEESELLSIFNETASNWNPESLTRRGRKYVLSDEQSDEIISRRKLGEKVKDIAKDFNLPAKFISWYTTKHIRDK